jgi:hypothetical protein
MDPMILACLTGVAAILSVVAVVVRNRRARNSK